MKQVPNKVLSFFQKLGFSDEEIELFFLLSQKGKQTTLELSRASGISRTQVYRLLENMKKKGTVKELIDEHRVMAEAVGIEQVKRLVAEKASESKQLEDSFSEVKQFFSGIVGQNQAETKVFWLKCKKRLLKTTFLPVVLLKSGCKISSMKKIISFLHTLSAARIVDLKVPRF